jgi:hypothetical protein
VSVSFFATQIAELPRDSEAASAPTPSGFPPQYVRPEPPTTKYVSDIIAKYNCSRATSDPDQKQREIAAQFPRTCTTIISPSAVRNSALPLGPDCGVGDMRVSDQSSVGDIGCRARYLHDQLSAKSRLRRIETDEQSGRSISA